MSKRAFYLVAILISSALLLTCCGGDGPNGPVKEKPNIVFFRAQPRNILVTDSTYLFWRTENADSVVILPQQLKVSTADSGRVVVAPRTTTEYAATAYNENGSTTLATTVNVEIVPFRVKTENGDFYKGQMGQSVLDRPLIFKVTDSAGIGQSGKLLHLTLVEGDGSLNIDSGLTDTAGNLPVSYTFDGSLGHAVVRARHSTYDSLDILVRANTLFPGVNGQVQYILWGDSWTNVRGFNGLPYSLDIYVDSAGNNVLQFVIANYEDDLGMVLFIDDPDRDGIIFDSSPVIGGIVADSVFLQPPDSLHFNTRYEGTISTPAGPVGIGTHYLDVISRMISLNSLWPPQVGLDPDTIPPWPAIKIDYPDANLFFRLRVTDSLVMQIEMQDPTHPAF